MERSDIRVTWLEDLSTAERVEERNQNIVVAFAKRREV
jgi:hypothetical protein